ncbi:MAG TPA: NADH-quinone oxidoreductase subunit M [Verrucomicrobiae bacterium]|nr:NADH-quinone oxidoreductase subunit M [Verrucomicrobiae bacterium]
MLAWTIYISFIGAALMPLLPRDRPGPSRKLALATSLAGFGIALAAAAGAHGGRMLTITRVPWVPALGMEYHLGADGISLVLTLLTGLASVAGVLFSWNIENRTREFFAFYLTLIGGVYGVFLSFDLMLLFVFYELAIVPKYFLIAIWGSTRREYGAMKLALYSFIGSAMVLAGIIAAIVVAGAKTTDLIELSKFPFPLDLQMWAFPLVFLGFAILAGLWPLHTWAPTGHVAAPTAASMLLAGVVMKLGAYGCLRVAMTLFPHGLDAWAFPPELAARSTIQNIQWVLHFLGFGSWQDVFGVLAVIGIVYGATIALVQRDFKFVIGYSSVSHMGFVLLGLITLNTIGMSGAVLQMFSHGVIASLLFAVVGRMVYDRTHTRDLNQLGPMNLCRLIPFAAVAFIIAGMASMGLPGFSGFIAELQVLIGTWRMSPTLAVITGMGIIVGIAFTIRALLRAFFADAGTASVETVSPTSGLASAAPAVSAITIPERLGAALLIAATLAVGIYPRLLLHLIGPSFDAPIFSALRKAGGW